MAQGAELLDRGYGCRAEGPRVKCRVHWGTEQSGKGRGYVGQRAWSGPQCDRVVQGDTGQ